MTAPGKNIKGFTIGAHCSVSGGYAAAADYLISIGGNTMQIFSGNPRGWKKKKIDTEKADEFTAIRKNKGIAPLVIHAPYLINIAADGPVYEKSAAALEDEIIRADILKADYFVLHPGSSGGASIEEGISRVTDSLNILLDKLDPAVKILLENTAGGGSSPGRDLDTLIKIRGSTGNRVGLCLDTAHAFESGYGVDSFLNHSYAKIAEVVHLNDSMTELGSGHDRHMHIGEGHIGTDGFRNIINCPALKDKPFIIETPKEEGRDRDNIALLKSLRAQ